MKDSDSKNCALYIVNGIICWYADYHKKYPTVNDVRENFNMRNIQQDVTNDEIQDVIERVKQYDERFGR